MITLKRVLTFTALAISLLTSLTVTAQRIMENLGRGLIATRHSKDSVFISWRLLGTDPLNLAFNLYRVTGDSRPVKLNAQPITAGTNYTDTKADFSRANS